jgi:hypothetical protein
MQERRRNRVVSRVSPRPSAGKLTDPGPASRRWRSSTPTFAGKLTGRKVSSQIFAAYRSGISPSQYRSGIATLFVFLLVTLALTLPAIAGASTGDANMAVCTNDALSGFSPALADCRAWEQVTPAFKDGNKPSVAAISPEGSRVLGASLGVFAGIQGDHGAEGGFYEFSRSPSGWEPSAVTPADASFPAAILLGASPGLERSLWFARTPSQSLYDQDLYVREADGEMVEVGPALDPAETIGEPAGEEHRFSYLGFVDFDGASDDLSHVAFTLLTGQPPRTGAPLWPGDTTNTESAGSPSLYEYAGAGEPQPVLVGVADSFTETVEGGNTVRVPPGTLISDCGTSFGSEGQEDTYNAMSDDGATVFFTAVGGCAAGIKAPDVSEVFARVDGFRTVAISEPAAGSCGACETGVRAPALFAGASEDGTHAFFMTTQPLLEHATSMNLYEYDANAPKSERVWRVSTGSSKPEVQGVARVSEDGSHVYFTAKSQLLPTGTADTSAGSDELTSVTTATGTGNLVEGEQIVEGLVTSTGVFKAGQTISGTGIAPGSTIARVGEGSLELSTPAEASGTAVALSAGAQPFAAGDTIVGAGIPAGDTITALNGQTLTLSAPASASASGMTVTAANREGATPTPGADNLYVYEHDEAFPQGRLQFVATLSPADSLDWAAEDNGRPVQASPDGRFLVFQSAADLTAGDTSSLPQVFEYDAHSEELIRVSVGQAGYAPGIANANANASQITTQNYGLEGDSPAARDTGLALSADGATVVFASAAALTPGAETAAAAGAHSVYEYHSGVAEGGRTSEGDVYLVSDGEDVAEDGGARGAFAEGIDESGADVFFETSDALAPGDGDTQYDLYDARVDGGFPLPPPTPSCQGEECQGAALVQPIFAAPSSASVAGNSNLTPPPPSSLEPPAEPTTTTPKTTTPKPVACKKGYVKQKGKCIKKGKTKKNAKSKGKKK